MGTTISSLHVLIRGTEITHDDVTAALLPLLEQQSYREVDDRDAAERAYYVVSKSGSQWVSLYNVNLTPTIDIHFYTELERLGAPLSQQVGAGVVHIDVYDSDVIHLRYFNGGALMDVFSNWANYESTPKKKIGTAQRWLPVLPETYSPHDLEKAWKERRADYPFEAEGILRRVVTVLQMDNELTHMTGHDFLDIEEDDENDDESSAMWVTQCYVKKSGG